MYVILLNIIQFKVILLNIIQFNVILLNIIQFKVILLKVVLFYTRLLMNIINAKSCFTECHSSVHHLNESYLCHCSECCSTQRHSKECSGTKKLHFWKKVGFFLLEISKRKFSIANLLLSTN